MKRLLWRMVAWFVLAVSFGGTLMIARLVRERRSRGPASRRILVTGTFYNHGWFISHLEPLACCGICEVIVVTDAPQSAPERVRVLCPSPRLVRVLGRAGAKVVLMWLAGRRWRPCMYMGYHLFPAGLSALLVARLRGRPAAYQMTGGPLELLGGGFSNENFLMSALGRPSRLLESLALAVVREFDLVVVRGQKARRYLAEMGVDQGVALITGSIRPSAVTLATRRIDLIFVGRLAPIKQPEQFVQIVERLARSNPNLRTVMIGAGPELDSLQREATRLGIRANIEFLGYRDDVSEFLRQAKVFVMTSRSEGMSIALMEAMGWGVPAVAADVGELSDLVVSGVNGWLVRPNDVEGYVQRISELLDDPVNWQRISNAAREAATELSGIDSVARRWGVCLKPFADVQGQSAR